MAPLLPMVEVMAVATEVATVGEEVTETLRANRPGGKSTLLSIRYLLSDF